ncbi:hypothetical protein V565_108710 [Rhizoctonia solani 123E]|uniref:DUF6589 domain-containing protein n=1 Tax=Rhizoctonia solani 123E TaxID=1423351 RepID=A0A074RQD3_9AGAM|nr:hypothetical protein V565_108710 [Rhizoctonia solani 123E]
MKVDRASFKNLAPPVNSPEFVDKYPSKATYLPEEPEPGMGALFNARQGLEEWMVRGTLAIVDREAAKLCEPNTGLPRGVGANWNTFDSFSLEQNQKRIMAMAPVIWILLSTVAFNRQSDNLGLDKSATLSPAGDEMDVDPAGPVETEHEAEHERLERDRRNPSIGVTMAVFMLIVFRNQAVNLFQHVLGVFLFACNAPKSLFLVLCRFGITSAHSTIHALLGRLGKSAYDTLADLGRKAYDSTSDATREPQEYFALLFDNINKYRLARKQTVASKNEMQNGTAATVVALEDVRPNAFDPQPYLENLAKQERRQLTTEQLYEDIDHLHLRKAGTAMILRLMVTHITTLSTLSPAVELWVKENCSRRPLRLRKSRTYPMGTSGIDESTASGGSDVLEDLSDQMKMEPGWFEKLLIMVCGDWLSVDRLRRARIFKSKDTNAYEQRQWALPIIQLWHMKWAYLKVIYKTHWSENSGPDVTVNLRHGLEALNRNFNHIKCDFYPGHEGVRTVFDTLVLTCLLAAVEFNIFGTTPAPPTAESNDTFTHTLSDLNKYFAPGGSYYNCSLDVLIELAETVYDNYFTTSSALGAGYMNTEELTSEQISAFLSQQMERLSTQSTADTQPHEDDGSDDTASSHMGSDIHIETGLPKHLLGDTALCNTILLIRDCFWYLEFATSVTEGDIGRVFDIIKVLRFSFWGGGASNYGNELLEMACNYFYEFPEDLQAAILDNYLVNTSGLPNHWHELDLLQEHYNLWIKRVFNKKNSVFDSNFLRLSVSVNVAGFGRLRDKLFHMIGLSRVTTGRSLPDYQSDINVLATHYRQNGLFKFERGRSQAFTANDIFAAGYDKLKTSALSKFLDRTSYDPTLIHENPPEEQLVHDPMEDVQNLNPLILQNGVLVPGAAPEFPE